jgi:predicted NUDIX family NTP pyrophosphohydrolase
MPKTSAGLLLYRVTGGVEVLLAHPGGPFWSRKDEGVWTVPKGEYEPGEDAFSAARREFHEETGHLPPDGDAIDLGALVQPSRKVVTVWALEGDLDVSRAVSNTFEMEWPRGSGRMREFPEVDRVEWAGVAEARRRLLKGQVPFLDRLLEALAARGRLDDGTRADEGSPPPDP